MDADDFGTFWVEFFLPTKGGKIFDGRWALVVLENGLWWFGAVDGSSLGLCREKLDADDFEGGT